MKKIIALMLCILVVFSLSACTAEKGLDAQLIFPIDNDPKFLDPQIISDVGARNIILNCFEGLVTLGANNEILPGMAEKWDVSADGKTYVFYLRQNSRWRVTSAAKRVLGGDNVQLYPAYDEKGKLIPLEEGKETFNITVTAHDFVFGLRRALRPETKCPTAYKLYAIEGAEEVHSGKLDETALGVTAIDDHTLKITLRNNDPDFLHTLLEPACMPCNEIFFEKTGGRYGLATRYLLYNGPFYINNWADNASVSVRKNADYYYDAKNVKPYSVYFSINDEQNTRLRKLKNETYDISPFTENQTASVADSKKYTINSFSSGMYSLIFNCKDTYLQNTDVRRAIVSAFNFNLFSSETGKTVTKHIFPSVCTLGDKSYTDSVKGVGSYSAQNPQALLRKGLDTIEQDTVTITVLCKADDELLARKLIQSWQATLGVVFHVSVETTDEYTLQSRIRKGNFQLALGEINHSGNNVHDAALKFTSDSRDNLFGYSSKSYDNKVKAISLAEGAAAKAQAVQKAEKHLSDAAVILPLYEVNRYVVHGSNVSGIVYNNTGDVLYFKNTLEK